MLNIGQRLKLMAFQILLNYQFQHWCGATGSCSLTTLETLKISKGVGYCLLIYAIKLVAEEFRNKEGTGVWCKTRKVCIKLVHNLGIYLDSWLLLDDNHDLQKSVSCINYALLNQEALLTVIHTLIMSCLKK